MLNAPEQHRFLLSGSHKERSGEVISALPIAHRFKAQLRNEWECLGLLAVCCCITWTALVVSSTEELASHEVLSFLT